MATSKVKTNASGSRHKARWTRRADAKESANVRRRAEDKKTATLTPEQVKLIAEYDEIIDATETHCDEEDE
jgi:hypothetical protein